MITDDEERFQRRSIYLGTWLSELYFSLVQDDDFQSSPTSSSPSIPLQPIPIIHEAGTKGKGTTCHGLTSMLTRHGLQVGLFVSPHIHTPLERIRVGHERISAGRYASLLAAARALPSGIAAPEPAWLLPFDRYLVVAMAHFLATPGLCLDALVLEVGVGGRCDSTTALLRSPTLHPDVRARFRLAAVGLVHISCDHQQILGDTLEAIAWQKAGIMAQGVPAFTLARQESEVLGVFRAEMAKISPDAQASVELCFEDDDGDPSREDDQRPPHWRNKPLIERLFFEITGVRASASTDDMRQPCRFEEFRVGSVRCILDGAHNGYSLRTLLQIVRHRHGDSRTRVLFGCGVSKCVGDMLAVLEEMGEGHETCFLQSTDELACSTAKLMAMKGEKLQPVVGANIFEEVEHSLQGPWDVVVICGSFYVAKDARAYLARKYPELFQKEDPIFEI